MMLNESLVSLMILCVCNTFICQIGKYAGGKESEEFQCIVKLRNVSHLKWTEIFILKAPILKITSWLTWQFITKLPNSNLKVRLKSLSSSQLCCDEDKVFGNQGVMELQERKRERQGIKAFVSFIIGPTINKFFTFFFFFIWWLLIGHLWVLAAEWSGTEIAVKNKIKIFWTGNLPSLVRNFSFNSFLLSLAKEAIFICFIVEAFLHKSKSSAFFPLPPSLSWMPLSPNYFHSSTVNFEEFSLIITSTVLNSLCAWKGLHILRSCAVRKALRKAWMTSIIYHV